MVAGFLESLGETAYKEVYNAAAKTSLQYVLVAIKLSQSSVGCMEGDNFSPNIWQLLNCKECDVNQQRRPFKVKVASFETVGFSNNAQLLL